MPVAIKSSDFQTATNLINESGLNSLQGRIAEAIAAERERCAKIAETIRVDPKGHPQIDAPTPFDFIVAIAAKIRQET